MCLCFYGLTFLLINFRSLEPFFVITNTVSKIVMKMVSPRSNLVFVIGVGISVVVAFRFLAALLHRPVQFLTE